MIEKLNSKTKVHLPHNIEGAEE